MIIAGLVTAPMGAAVSWLLGQPAPAAKAVLVAVVAAVGSAFVVLLLFLLWDLVSAPYRIHSEQDRELKDLRPEQAPRPPGARVRALRRRGGRKKGEFYEVPHRDLPKELRKGMVELVTGKASLRLLLQALDRICAVCDEFSLSPPTHGTYHPSGNRLLRRWEQALDEAERCLKVAELEYTGPKYEPVKLWLGMLQEETDGEGRLHQYEDRVKHLREWISSCRSTPSANPRISKTDS